MSDGKPILGICRGIQLINIGLGGTIYQDLEMQLPKDTPVLCHRQPYPPALPSHYVTVTPGSLLASISESDRLEVNSLPPSGCARSGSWPDSTSLFIRRADRGCGNAWLSLSLRCSMASRISLFHPKGRRRDIQGLCKRLQPSEITLSASQTSK